MLPLERLEREDQTYVSQPLNAFAPLTHNTPVSVVAHPAESYLSDPSKLEDSKGPGIVTGWHDDVVSTRNHRSILFLESFVSLAANEANDLEIRSCGAVSPSGGETTNPKVLPAEQARPSFFSPPRVSRWNNDFHQDKPVPTPATSPSALLHGCRPPSPSVNPDDRSVAADQPLSPAFSSEKDVAVAEHLAEHVDEDPHVPAASDAKEPRFRSSASESDIKQTAACRTASEDEHAVLDKKMAKEELFFSELFLRQNCWNVGVDLEFRDLALDRESRLATEKREALLLRRKKARKRAPRMFTFSARAIAAYNHKTRAPAATYPARVSAT